MLSAKFQCWLTLCFLTIVSAQSCWRNTTCNRIREAAFPGPWDANIYAPSSRTVAPKSVLTGEGRTTRPWSPPEGLPSNGSRLVFDFGKEVGGIVTLRYAVRGSGRGAVGLAFSEARNWIGEWSDSSNGAFRGPDGAIYSNFSGPGDVVYTMPDEKLRGGFRYLTLFLVAASASVEVQGVSLEIGFQPTWSNLRAYQGYFHSDDELLNRIWYAGAYTLQTNAVPSQFGRRSPFVRTGWANNGSIGNGDTVLVDGAKRDRAVWPGDMGIAVPSSFVSTGDLDSVRNALQTMYDYMNSDGSFPEAGPPLLQQGSDTYHMWSLIGTYNYVLYTNDTAFLRRNWPKYLRAMAYITAKQTYASGLLRVTGTRDWARWQTGYNMTEAQMILYRTLATGVDCAAWMSDASGAATRWAAAAASLRTAVTTHCFDPARGAFRDNATDTSLYPQDANALSLALGLVDPGSAAAQSISARLLDNWTPLGPAAPELPGNVSPFVSSFEVHAHLAAGQTARALELIRRSWGWYLDHPDGSQSTAVEGFLVDGTWGYRSNRGYGNDPSYVSHAHGWSTGPTSALTESVLGLAVTGRAGETWRFAPQLGDLTRAEGGFVTRLGRFRAGWKRDAAGGGFGAELSSPTGTRGVLVLPVVRQGVMPRVVVDGERVDPQWRRKGSVVFDTVAVEVAGGDHTVVVSNS